MSISDYIVSKEKRSVTLDLEVKNFSDIGYWIRSLKRRFKKNNIEKMFISIRIEYLEEEE